MKYFSIYDLLTTLQGVPKITETDEDNKESFESLEAWDDILQKMVNKFIELSNSETDTYTATRIRNYARICLKEIFDKIYKIFEENTYED